jgi:hypothetical protein
MYPPLLLCAGLRYLVNRFISRVSAVVPLSGSAFLLMTLGYMCGDTMINVPAQRVRIGDGYFLRMQGNVTFSSTMHRPLGAPDCSM